MLLIPPSYKLLHINQLQMQELKSKWLKGHILFFLLLQEVKNYRWCFEDALKYECLGKSIEKDKKGRGEKDGGKEEWTCADEKYELRLDGISTKASLR